MRRAMYVAIVSVLLLSGCTTAPSQERLAVADYGPEPINREQIVRDHLRVMLKDPDSVKDFLVMPPTRGFFQVNAHAPVQYGWLCPVKLNAKNSFGGYVGTKLYLALIRDGRVLQFKDSQYVSNATGGLGRGAFGQGRHLYGFAHDTKPKR